MNISEPYSSSILWSTQLSPVYPINLSFVPGLTPPILSQNYVHAITNYSRNFENAHGICTDGLGHRFDKNLHPCFGDVLFFPTHHFFGNPFLEFFKSAHFWSSLKVLNFDFPPTMGNPRYFSQLNITYASNIIHITS